MSSKSEAMVVCRKKVDYSLWVDSELLPQVKEFKYVGILFTSEGQMKREVDRQTDATSAVMRAFNWTAAVKKEPSQKAKLSIYQLVYVPTYGHELWVETERIRLRIQAAKMSFLQRVSGLSLGNKVRSSDIRGKLRVEPAEAVWAPG